MIFPRLISLGQVTLFTRGKTPITQQIPDDTPEFYKEYCSKIKHLAGNRQEADSVKALLKGHKWAPPIPPMCHPQTPPADHPYAPAASTPCTI